MISNKTIEKYIKLIHGSKWTKQEISGFLKLLRSSSYIKDVGTKDQIEHLKRLFSETTVNKEYNITKEHSKQGLDWLQNKVLLKRGGVSKSSGFDHPDADTIQNFKCFKFVGIHQHYNAYSGEYTNFSPIFRIVAKDCVTLDYSPTHWGPALTDNELNYL